MSTLPALTSGAADRMLAGQTLEIAGRVDLARLAAMLPGVLRIRDDVALHSGQVDVALSSRPAASGVVLLGKLESKNIVAIHGEKTISWDRPITINLAAHQGQAGLTVESFECHSDFLTASGSGTVHQASGSGSFDLNRAAAQLSQIVDFGGITLRGDGSIEGGWTLDAENRFSANARLLLRGFHLALPERPAWAEDNLTVVLAVDGRQGADGTVTYQTASLQVQSGEDRLGVDLTEPVAQLDVGPWPVKVSGSGRLERWPGRLAAWVDTAEWRTVGAFELEAAGVATTENVDVAQCRLNLTRSDIATPWLNLKEPRAELVVSGRWNVPTQHLELRSAELDSVPLTLHGEQIVVDIPAEGLPTAAGLLAFRAELSQLADWLAPPADPTAPRWRYAGNLEGTAELRHKSGIVHAKIDGAIRELLVTGPAGQRHAEPLVNVTAEGRVDVEKQVVHVMAAKLNSATLGVETTADYDFAVEQPKLVAAGHLTYDLGRISQATTTLWGSPAYFAGSGTRPFSYRGPLDPASALAHASAAWEMAGVSTFTVGPGELKTTLADGVLHVEPMSLDFSGGRLNLAAKLHLATDPMRVDLPPGTLAQQVQITQEMCSSWLQYIAPVVADAAWAKGSFSIELDGGQIPLDDYTKADVGGRMIVHAIEVGPGPMIQEFATLLGYSSPGKLKQASVVPFRVVGGRVYHENLELQFPELTIRTHGSVGFDQSVALMAEMPVPPKWIGSNRIGTALQNQTIRLPVAGTLSSPKIDQRVLQQVSAQFIQRGVQNLLQDQLGDQFNRLFGPSKPVE